MDASSTIQNRRSRRSNVLLAASIEFAGAELPVKLRNLSADGALIEGERLPLEGSVVLFRRNELKIRSRIAWVQGRHAGVSFGVPLKAEEVLRNIPKPRQRITLDCRRPGLCSRELSPGEQRLVEQWVRTAPRDLLGE